MALSWISSKPTRVGFYWCHGEGMRKRVVEIRDEHGLYVVHTGKLLIEIGEDEYRWAGPIPEPSE